MSTRADSQYRKLGPRERRIARFLFHIMLGVALVVFPLKQLFVDLLKALRKAGREPRMLLDEHRDLMRQIARIDAESTTKEPDHADRN